jgi:6-phosphogluconolactonase
MSPDGTDVLYVAVGGDEPRLMCYAIGKDGVGEPSSFVDLPGAPADLAVSPDKRFLYADIGVDGVHQYLSFRIDAASGALERIGTPAHVGAYPCYLHVDNSGRWLLAAYYADGMVTVHAIGEDGVAGGRVQQLETAMKAHYIGTDASNRFAFTPHVGDENAIWQFRFDSRTGQLTANEPCKASPDPGTGPRHMCFHPNGRFAFSNGEQGSSVTSWALAPETGTLAALHTLSTLPDGWEGDNTCSQINITADGHFVFSCNRGHDSVAAFAVDADSGGLTALGSFPAQGTPRPLAVAADGTTLFAAGSALRSYRISASGTLDKLADLDPGPIAWILAVRT